MTKTVYRDELIEKAASSAGISFFRGKEIVLTYLALIETETRLQGYSRFLKVCAFRPTGAPRAKIEPLQAQFETLALRAGFTIAEVETVLLNLNELISYEVSLGNEVVVTSLVKIQPDLEKKKVYFFKAEAFGQELDKPIRVVRDPRFLDRLF